jgi:hypothetical protein
MGPMVPPQMAFLRRWPWRTRSKGPALKIADELVVRRERKRLRELDDTSVESIVPARDAAIVDDA